MRVCIEYVERLYLLRECWQEVCSTDALGEDLWWSIVHFEIKKRTGPHHAKIAEDDEEEEFEINCASDHSDDDNREHA